MIRMCNMFYVEESLTGEDVVKYIVFGIWENCTLLKVSMLCFLCTAIYYHDTGKLLYTRSLGARELRFVTSLAKIDSNYTFKCKKRAMKRLADGAEIGGFAGGRLGSQHLCIYNTLRQYSSIPDDRLKDIAKDIAEKWGKEDPFYYVQFVHFDMAAEEKMVDSIQKKYEICRDISKRVYGRKVYRIRALRDFRDVKAGDLGGWIESEKNLSQQGNCWIYDDAVVMEDARVKDDATVGSHAVVGGNVVVTGHTVVGAYALIGGRALIRGRAKD